MSRPLGDLLFRPRGIVVYGASADPAKLSGRPLAYLKRFGFGGSLYAVNPNRTEVQGVPAFPDIAHVPEDADLAVVVVPAAMVVDAIRRCGEAGIGAAIIFASGFAEVDAAGASLQAELAAAAKETRIRVLGPNCLGSFAAGSRAFATFSTAFDDVDGAPESPIAIVSQSGAVGTFTFSEMNATGLGARYYANPGNAVDITVAEVLRALVDADDVDILMGHLEDGSDLAGLEDLARAARDRRKPLLILKGGRTPAGARAIGRHTGSAQGDVAAIDELLARYGAVSVDSMQAWADAALAFSDGRIPAGPRVTIVTQSGGAGAIATDRAVINGLTVDPWSHREGIDELARDLPSFASLENPIDLTGALINDVSLLRRSLELCSESPDTDTTLVVLGNTDSGVDDIVPVLIEAHGQSKKPFLVAWTGGSGRPRRLLLEAGVPCYSEPNRAVDAIRGLVTHGTAG